jgi:hypothetical protein
MLQTTDWQWQNARLCLPWFGQMRAITCEMSLEELELLPQDFVLCLGRRYLFELKNCVLCLVCWRPPACGDPDADAPFSIVGEMENEVSIVHHSQHLCHHWKQT